MTLRQFAFNNVVRNMRLYAAYFLSSAFSVMVFFVYSMFAFHPALADTSIHKNVSFAMHFAESVIYVFSFFFVLYSMGAFLKSRKREFGILIMHGMTNMQLRRLVFLENMMIGFGATVTGIVIGLVFSKLILLMAQNVLRLDQALPFYQPRAALLLTFGAFIALFFAISLFTVTILRGHKLIELIKGTARPKPEPKASAFLSWTALLLLAGGYTVALIVKGTLVFTAMVPVTLVVTAGTYLLFTQLSVYVIRKGRGNKRFFWNRTNLVLFSDLAYRMKDNARTFFMVAILSTVAFSAIGSLIGFKSMYTSVMKKENPYAMEYYSRAGNPDNIREKHLASIRQALSDNGLRYQEYGTAIRYAPLESGKPVAFVRASSFNALAEAAGEEKALLKESQAAVVYYSNRGSNQAPELSGVRVEGFDRHIEAVQALSSVIMPLFQSFYVLHDDMFDQLSGVFLPDKQEEFVAFDVTDSTSLKEMGAELYGKLGEDSPAGKFRFLTLDVEMHLMDQNYGTVLFIGFFIGVVFFVGAGSFLYFRLYTDLEEDKRKFHAIRKLGLSDAELAGILTKQLMILFFVPITVALIHGAVALTAMQNMFTYNLVRECAAVLGAFMLIQIAYFLLIRSRYIANVKR